MRERGFVAATASDEDLVRETLAGRVAAFETLVARHRDVVYRVAARIVGHGEAEDVTQDTFLRAFHRLTQFRGESPFRYWLLRIAHNAALNALARQRPMESPPVDEDTGRMPHAGERTPAEELEVNERRERLERKLREVSAAHRTVLVLRDIEGLSYEEIAQVTDAPLGSVKGRLFRARLELIELLRRNTYDWELPGERASA